MTDRMPDDPFEVYGILGDLASAERLWEALEAMSIEEAMTAVREGLSESDLREMVATRVICSRLRIRPNADGWTMEREDPPEPKPRDDKPEGGWG